jgi:hypothetical protein
MVNNLQRKNFKRQITRQERNKLYSKSKALTLWDMIDEKSKQTLMQAKAKANIINNK